MKENKKNILFICGCLEKGKDGVGDYTRILTSHLTKNYSINVSIIALNDKYVPTTATEQHDGINILRIASSSQAKKNGLLKKLIEQIQPDLISLQYVPYGFNKYGIPFLLPFRLLLCCLFKKIKIVTTFHEVRIKREFRKNLIISILQGIIVKILYLISNRTITSNNFYKDLIWKNGSTQIIPIGSNVTPDNYLELNGRFQKKDKFVISSFGTGIKSYKIILQSVAILYEEIKNIELKFIGNIKPTELQTINQLAEQFNISHVLKIPGFLPSEKVFEELVNSDVYLMLEDIYKPSSWVGLSHKSGTFAAALSAGLPIIAFKGELTDKELNTQDFIIFVPENSNDIKDAIIRIHQHSELFRANDIISYYQQNISFKVIAEQYLNIYKNV